LLGEPGSLLEEKAVGFVKSGGLLGLALFKEREKAHML
jgi:hypothetical protein